MRKEKVLLTPELAAEFLKKNYKKNRRIREAAVNKYALDIISNRWDPDISNYQDPIIFSVDGLMRNGQHRCKAVIKTGIPILIYVVYDAPIEIYEMLDGGTPRSAADFIDVPNKTNGSALAKIVCAIEDGAAPLASALQGKMDHRTQVTRKQILEKIDSSNERLQSFVRSGQNMAPYIFNKKTYASTALYIIDYVGKGDVVERFVSECSSMTTSSSQVNSMRAYMCKCISNKNFKADQKWVISCILSTYEAFRNDVDIKQFNKLSLVFSKYDKYVFETRESLRK